MYIYLAGASPAHLSKRLCLILLLLPLLILLLIGLSSPAAALLLGLEAAIAGLALHPVGRLGLLDFFLQPGGLLEPPPAPASPFVVTPSPSPEVYPSSFSSSSCCWILSIILHPSCRQFSPDQEAVSAARGLSEKPTEWLHHLLFRIVAIPTDLLRIATVTGHPVGRVFVFFQPWIFSMAEPAAVAPGTSLWLNELSAGNFLFDFLSFLHFNIVVNRLNTFISVFLISITSTKVF